MTNEAVKLASAVGTPVRSAGPGYNMPTYFRIAVREPGVTKVGRCGGRGGTGGWGRKGVGGVWPLLVTDGSTYLPPPHTGAAGLMGAASEMNGGA